MTTNWKIGIALAAFALAVFVGLQTRSASTSISPIPEKPMLKENRATLGNAHQVPTRTPDLIKWLPLLDDSLPRQKRVELTNGIREGISSEEIAFLFTALDHQPRAGTEEQWWVVMNEIMERLRKQGLGADQYSSRLKEIAADSRRPEVVRDYAIQHLLQWLSPANPSVFPGESDPQQRRDSFKGVTQIIRDPSLRHTTIPGTALLALADASLRLPQDEVTAVWEELDAFLAPLVAGGSDASLGLHVSAIQAAALMGRAVHLPAIRALAMNESAEPSLRLTSIAALGIFGAQDSRRYLDAISLNGGRFSYAAKAAILQMDQKRD